MKKIDLDREGFLDIWQKKLTSRRFLAWLVATGCLLAGVLTSSDWTFITVFFIGGEILERYEKVIMNYLSK